MRKTLNALLVSIPLFLGSCLEPNYSSLDEARKSWSSKDFRWNSVLSEERFLVDSAYITYFEIPTKGMVNSFGIGDFEKLASKDKIHNKRPTFYFSKNQQFVRYEGPIEYCIEEEINFLGFDRAEKLVYQIYHGCDTRYGEIYFKKFSK